MPPRRCSGVAMRARGTGRERLRSTTTSVPPRSRPATAWRAPTCSGCDRIDAVAAVRSPDGAKRNPGTDVPDYGAARLHPGYKTSRPSASIQRFELDDRAAVIVADPERHRAGRVVDEHATDVGLARQQVVDERPALR